MSKYGWFAIKKIRIYSGFFSKMFISSHEFAQKEKAS